MTTDEIAEYYANLLIIQYNQKPKARAEIKAIVTPLLMDQLPIAVRDAYNVDTAVGVQLDVLGEIVGISRNIKTFTSTLVLNDTDYRLLIKVKIIKNTSGSSLKSIQALLKTYFPNSIRVFDYQNMSMCYFIDSTQISLSLAEAIVRSKLLPKPMAVQLGAVIYLGSIANIFGFRTYTVPNTSGKPFNNYTSYDLSAPWLSYADALS